MQRLQIAQGSKCRP